MTQVVPGDRRGGGRLRIARSRGAASGLVVIILGAWGALIPFMGPAFDFAYDEGQGAAWSAARGWLEVLPGVVAVIGGFLLVRSQNRATAMLGGWLSVLAGAWFVVGRVMATTLTIGEIGRPVAETETKAAWLELTYFYGLGALIVFVGAMALGRLSVLSVRDVGYAEKSALRRGRRNEVVEESNDEVYRSTATGSTPTQPIAGEPVTDERRPRRRWHNPLGRRRDNPTTVGR